MTRTKKKLYEIEVGIPIATDNGVGCRNGHSVFKVVLVFICRYMIESPRWLTNRGRLDKAAEVLNHIAKINGKSPEITEKLLRTALPTTEPEKVYGMLSLFSGLRLAKNTVILIICW